MKTVNVQVTLQLDIETESGDILADVQKHIDFINNRLSVSGLQCEPQIFTSAIDLSDITESKGGFEIGDEVEVPEPNETDIHNHSFVGTIAEFRGDNAIVEDGDGDCFEIEVERLSNPYID